MLHCRSKGLNCYKCPRKNSCPEYVDCPDLDAAAKEQREKLLDLARSRGYTEHSYTADHSQYNFVRPDGLGLLLYPDKDEFELYYSVTMLVHMKIEKASPFSSDKQFSFMESQLAKYVNIIKAR